MQYTMQLVYDKLQINVIWGYAILHGLLLLNNLRSPTTMLTRIYTFPTKTKQMRTNTKCLSIFNS